MEATIAVVIAVLSSRRASQPRGSNKKTDEQCVVFVEREELEEDSANTWKEWMVFDEQCAVCRLVVMVVVFVSMYSCCFLCWNTSPPGRQIACSLALSRQWGICSRNITPEPVMSRTFGKSKLAVNRKRSAVDCSLFEARGPKLAAVCSKVCVWFFRTYEYFPRPPPPLSLLGRLHVPSELFSSIFNVRWAVYAQDEDSFFPFLYLPNKIHCDRAFGHTPLYYILNPPPPCALGRTNARSINTPAQQGHFR